VKSNGDVAGLARPWEMHPGAAPVVVLVHGVGFGPGTLTQVARALQDDFRVLVVTRRGYGERSGLPPAADVADHVDDLLEQAATLTDGPVVVAGMSGGATVALAAALTEPDRVSVAIAHEPAAGSLSPELRSLVSETLSESGGAGLLRMLAGERTWESLDRAGRAELDAAGSLVAADARAFLAFEPRLPAVPGFVSLVCSVGSLSAPLRHTVAARIAGATGAPIEVLPNSGHLPQLDAPDAFAALIRKYALVAVH